MPTVCTIIPLRERTNVPRMYVRVHAARRDPFIGCDLIICRSTVAEAKSGCVRYAANSRRVKNRHCKLHKIYPVAYVTRPYPWLRKRDILSIRPSVYPLVTLIHSKNSLSHPLKNSILWNGRYYHRFYLLYTHTERVFTYCTWTGVRCIRKYWLILKLFFVELRFVNA